MTFDCQTNMKQTDSLKVTSSEFAQFCVHRCNWMQKFEKITIHINTYNGYAML